MESQSLTATSESRFLFKIVAVGDGRVGKTSLIRRFAENKFDMNYLPTLGVDITTKSLSVSEKSVKLICLDTAGQEFFGKLRPQYYHGANGALVVYDITDKETFDNVPVWLDELRRYISDLIPMILVANKVDLEDERKVRSDDGERLANEQDLGFYETSAKADETNVEVIFQDLASRILTRYGKI